MTSSKWAVTLVVLLANALAAPVQAADDGRLLASGCFQCHATNGRGGFDSIAGKSKAEILKDLNEMRRESPGSDIMVPHARGYTAEQLNLIADYFARQQR